MFLPLFIKKGKDSWPLIILKKNKLLRPKERKDEEARICPTPKNKRRKKILPVMAFFLTKSIITSP